MRFCKYHDNFNSALLATLVLWFAVICCERTATRELERSICVTVEGIWRETIYPAFHLLTLNKLRWWSGVVLGNNENHQWWCDCHFVDLSNTYQGDFLAAWIVRQFRQGSSISWTTLGTNHNQTMWPRLGTAHRSSEALAARYSKPRSSSSFIKTLKKTRKEEKKQDYWVSAHHCKQSKKLACQNQATGQDWLSFSLCCTC